jgi:hypothetical protein
MTAIAYLLTIDGCPYSFGTAGCPASVDLPPGVAVPVFDWSADWIVQPGLLEWPAGRVVERMATSDGQLEVSALDFRLHDHPLSGGPYADESALRLFTKRARAIAHAALAADFAAGDAALTIASAAGFPSGAQTVWCELEALRVSRSGTTLTVSPSAPIGWGYLGSRAADHRLDPARSYAPVVWSEFPGAARRRCTLWEVDAEGYARAVWRGRVARQHLDDDGERYVLACDHAWSALRDVRPGAPGASGVSVRVSGWWLRGVDSTLDFGLVTGALSAGVNGTVFSAHGDDEGERVCATLDELLFVVGQRLAARLVAAGLTATYATLTLDTDGAVVLQVIGPDSELTTASLTVAGEGYVAEPEITTVSGVRTVVCRVPADSVPAAYLPVVGNGLAEATVVIDRTLGLPSSFVRSTITSVPGLVTYEPMLLGELDDARYGDRYLLAFRPSSVSGAEGTARGSFEFVPRRRDVPALRGSALRVLHAPQTLRLCAAITADHWAYAIDFGLASWSPSLVSPVDARDWSRERERQVVAATDSAAELSRARWYLDGERPLGEMLSAHLRLYGCAVGLGSMARMCLVPLRPPLPTDPTAAGLTADDYLDGSPPRVEQLDESLLTSARLEAGSLTVQVSDADAEARYGATAPIELATIGAVEGLAQDLATPDTLALHLLRYVLGAWASPSTLHTLTVSYDRFGRQVRLGDALRFDSFAAPDGSGGRGVVAERGVVISREWDFDGDALALGVLVFDAAERIAALAPCLRVQSVSGATITIAKDYLDGSITDYAGSNLPTYRYALAGEDGGTSWATTGQRWRLVTRDAATELSQGGLVVTGRNTGARTLTFSAAIPTGVQDWAAYVAGGGIADLVFDDYASALDEEQRGYAFVASESAATIGGTGDSPNRWAP